MSIDKSHTQPILVANSTLVNTFGPFTFSYMFSYFFFHYKRRLCFYTLIIWMDVIAGIIFRDMAIFEVNRVWSNEWEPVAPNQITRKFTEHLVRRIPVGTSAIICHVTWRQFGGMNQPSAVDCLCAFHFKFSRIRTKIGYFESGISESFESYPQTRFRGHLWIMSVVDGRKVPSQGVECGSTLRPVFFLRMNKTLIHIHSVILVHVL